MSAVSRIPCRQDMKDRNDHKGDLSGKIHEDDDYQHHRDSPGVSAMNVWIYRHCISSRIKNLSFSTKSSCLELKCATQFCEIEKGLNFYFIQNSKNKSIQLSITWMNENHWTYWHCASTACSSEPQPVMSKWGDSREKE